MLSGVFYGAQYGGSTTAILVKIPGETSSVVTILDGHAMAQQGRAGPALAIAAIGSLFAGSVVTLLIAAAGPPLASVALLFQSADYVSVMVLGLVSAVVLANGSVLKAIAMIVLGVLFGTVGTDTQSGAYRMTLRHRRAVRRPWFRADLDGHLRPGRDRLQHRASGQGGHDRRQGDRPDAEACRHHHLSSGHDPRDDRGHGVRNPAGRGADDCVVLRLYAREENVRASRALRPRRDRRRGGAGIRQQRRRAGVLHSDAQPRHPAQRPDGADDRRPDGARHSSPGRTSSPSSRNCSGD